MGAASPDGLFGIKRFNAEPSCFDENAVFTLRRFAPAFLGPPAGRSGRRPERAGTCFRRSDMLRSEPSYFGENAVFALRRLVGKAPCNHWGYTVKYFFLLVGLLLPFVPDALPAREQWASPPPYRGPASRGMSSLDEMQRQAYERDRERRRREQEQVRRDEDERRRRQWRLEDERRREAHGRLDERARDWERRALHEKERVERLERELQQRREDGGAQGSDSGGSRRTPEYRGKKLDARELRRYGLIRSGERP
jgi:hypothetical protein